VAFRTGVQRIVVSDDVQFILRFGGSLSCSSVRRRSKEVFVEPEMLHVVDIPQFLSTVYGVDPDCRTFKVTEM
jgi:hypothetical protein